LLSEPTTKVAVFQLSKLRSGASATPKQQGPEGRTGPAGNGLCCLTLLSEPTRKVAIFQLSKLRNGASDTPKQQGPEGRTGPAGNRPYCLTLLSEPTNSKALKDGLGLPATAPTA